MQWLKSEIRAFDGSSKRLPYPAPTSTRSAGMPPSFSMARNKAALSLQSPYRNRNVSAAGCG